MISRIPYPVSRNPLPSVTADFAAAGHEYGIRNTEYELRDFARRVNRSMRAAFSLVTATLREIFDENAYARFLQRGQLQPSGESYAKFLRENACRRERRPRCC